MILVAACVTPLGTSSHPNAAGRSQTASAARAGNGSASAAQATTLRVNSETVDAAELWSGEHADLVEKAQRLSAADYQAFLHQKAAALINDRIAEMLLYQQASLRMEPRDSETIDRFIDERLRKIVTEEFGGIQRRYEKSLESNGQTLDDVRAKYRRELIISRYLETEIRPKLTEPTRGELWEAFHQNIESLRRSPRQSMSLIDVRIQDRLPDDVDQPTREQQAEARRAARERIEAARLELQDGAEFAALARRYSDGLAAAEGGAWGWVTKESVRKRFEPAVAALYELKKGEVSGVVETDDGFFLVRCDDFDPGVEPDFQGMQPQLRENLMRARYNRLIAERVRELREKARLDPSEAARFHAAVVAAAPQQGTANSR